MNLKRIEVQGFKTFANRTILEVEPGVTCVVGPNGSGKSNLADAVRWVLGEQSLRLVRCRRTEDLIFAGGARRPAVGMAEVSIALDNSSGWLDVPYSEVSLTRRAYRSGENEYLINRERARLRDVSDVLARAGLGAGTYVVVGQGLVDLALSLRPEDRRELFEEAAAVAHHRSHLAEAREKLGQTDQNLARVRDVVAEIEPHLRMLERQARQAREAESVAGELAGMLVAWYGQRWCASAEHARLSAARATQLRVAGEEWQARASELAARQIGLAQKRIELETGLAGSRREVAELREQREAHRRDLAVCQERRQAGQVRLDEAQTELASQQEARDAELAALAECKSAAAAAHARVLSLSEEMALAQSAAGGMEDRRRELRARLQAAQHGSAANAAALAGAEGETHALADRRDGIEGRLSHLRAAARDLEERAGRADGRRQALEREAAAVAAQAENLAAERSRLEEGLAETRGLQRDLERETGDLLRQSLGLEARLEALNDWRDQQAGYYPGVKAVLRAAGARRETLAQIPPLPGVVGVVAELLQSPERLEVAIEVALGTRLQDVVVERWVDAEVAVDFLKRTGAGRATFLPLDTLRAGRPEAAPTGYGVVGVAARLVRFEPRHRVVVEHLLGRSLIVEDLPTARRILSQIGAGWQIVTLGGELVRSSGSITGGSSGSASKGVLARQRELQSLPPAIADLTARRRAARDALQAAERAEQEVHGDLLALRRSEQDLLAARRSQEAALMACQREAVAVEEERRSRLSEAERLAQELAALAASVEARAGRIERLRAAASGADVELSRLVREVEESESADGAMIGRLAELRAARASAERDELSLGRETQRTEAAVASLEQRLAERRARARQLAETIQALDSEVQARVCALAEVESRVALEEAAVGPIESELATIGTRALAAQRDEDRARLEAQAAVVAHRQAEQEMTESLANHEALRRQIGGELASVEQVDGALRVQVNGEWVVLGSAPCPADGLEERIAQLRARLRALGGGGSVTVIEEYEQTQSRHTFLLDQVRDLETAAAGLMQVISELERTIRRRFAETFVAIGSAFGRNFATLFGGGSAQLLLTDADDPESAGIEILAQPPGRRGHGLAQLSGGERALTAAALLFSIIEVNPPPFCVLDEVDAALDEANVGRFCELLMKLAEGTQFLVITHNRRTMEAAGALYGLSLEDKCVSRIFSLRLADAPAVP